MSSNGFSDSSSIVVRDGTPYFKCNGSSYVERLKNGISLDYVFSIAEFDIINANQQIISCNQEQHTNKKCAINEFTSFEDYDCKVSSIATKSRNNEGVSAKLKNKIIRLSDIQKLPNYERKKIQHALHQQKFKIKQTRAKKPNIRKDGNKLKLFAASQHLMLENDYDEDPPMQPIDDSKDWDSPYLYLLHLTTIET